MAVTRETHRELGLGDTPRGEGPVQTSQRQACDSQVKVLGSSLEAVVIGNLQKGHWLK